MTVVVNFCVIRSDILDPTSPPKLGEAKLRGLSNDVIPADIVRLGMKMAHSKGFSNVTCVVVKDLHCDLILGSDLIDRLNEKASDEVFDANDVTNLDESDDDSDAIDVDVNVVDDVDDDRNVASDETDNDNREVKATNENTFDPRKANADMLKQEQRSDKSLAGCFSLAEQQKTGYFFRDGILYRNEKLLVQEYEQLVLPYSRRAEVIKMAHDTCGCHLGSKRTKERTKLSFTSPTIASDVQRACESCHKCQKRKGITVYDRVPITPIPRDEVPSECMLIYNVWDHYLHIRISRTILYFGIV